MGKKKEQETNNTNNNEPIEIKIIWDNKEGSNGDNVPQRQSD